MTGPRIALMGFMLETNGFAPVATEEEFREKLWMEGEELLADIRGEGSRDPGGLCGFAASMDGAGPWTPVPLVITSASASGPADQDFFERYVARIRRELEAAMPLDGVYIEAHGAASATGDFDPDGTLFAAVREVVGPDVKVIATLDLHANVGPRMVEATDMLIAFLTNPHVDMYERGVEAAAAMRELLAGTRTKKAFVKLPILPPSVSLLTARGPYADAIRRGQESVGGPIMNVSICGNFSLADSPKNGISVTVTARGDQQAADRVARELAAGIWADRERFQANLTPIAEAVAMMKAACADPSLPALLFADVADNPGGGARGNTTDLLAAFLEAGIGNVAFAIHYDRPLAAEAHRLGKGARFTAHLNSEESDPGSKPLEVQAQVMALSDGTFVGRRGMMAGRTVSYGPTARLRLAGRIDIVVVSVRQQCADPMTFEHLGIDLKTVRGIAVKSRGHFRAGFDDLFPDARTIEIDGPGLVTPMLARVPFRNVPRPLWPLDPDMTWEVPEKVAV
ncbi:M81 family metallopeptidase [Marinimicrococcus flavescens]|uniref:Microcystinase C n=1 Tax=Marinimicrococcus flavescens TaxID=3031815 RepID=A0AAP3XRJ1_9PROT|nr:M81 family metallopeptidase [Marinimicrococcus flavescens]